MLKGKKTYIVSLVGYLAASLYFLDLLVNDNPQTEVLETWFQYWEMVAAVLATTGGITLRHAIGAK